jgi:ferrous iron transport protein A
MTPPALTICTLAELPTGKAAVIQEVISESLRARLMAMGCLPGEPIMITHKAPFGGPIAIEIFGYRLSLRKIEAKAILVNPAH